MVALEKPVMVRFMTRLRSGCCFMYSHGGTPCARWNGNTVGSRTDSYRCCSD
jgi:hypothetical protein